MIPKDNAFCPYCMSAILPGQPCPNCGLTEGSYTPAPHHLPPGTVLSERYLVGRVLGEGGFGITYIGCDLRLELKVAIKEYFPTDRASRHSASTLDVIRFAGNAAQNFEVGKERFLYEARTMARMDKQPQIVSVRDYFEANCTAYIVMEYVAGTNLKELVAQRGGKLPPSELLPTLQPLFKALQDMHDLGLIHRDISPDNLMLENGTVRLLDFGCARESASGSETMTIALKQGYAPIEQYQQSGQGPWTDVYALAATIYYCLSGKTPPRAVDRVFHDELLMPQSLGVALTTRQEQTLLRALSVRPRQRYQSMREFCTALYQEDIEPIPPRPVPAPTPKPPIPNDPDVTVVPHTGSRRTVSQVAGKAPDTPSPSPEAPLWKRPWFLAAAATFVVAAVVLLALLLPGKDKPAPSLDAPSQSQSETSDPAPAPDESESPQLPADIPQASVEEVEAFYEGIYDEEAFLSLLEDDRYTMITLRSGSVVELKTKPIALTKKLRLEYGSDINMIQPITIEAGGELILEGAFYADSYLRTNGGSITVKDGGSLSGLRLVLQKEEDLVVESNGVVQDYLMEHLAFYDETAMRENAVQVSSWEEFLAAANGPDTNGILITEDFDLQQTVVLRCPCIIEEGVTLGTSVPGHWNWDVAPSLIIDDDFLVNYGTFNALLQIFDEQEDGNMPGIINYGTLGNDLLVQKTVRRPLLLNFGTIELTAADLLNAEFFNQGVARFQTMDKNITWSNFICCTVYNLQEMHITGTEEAGHQFRFNGNGSYLTNAGTLSVNHDALLINEGLFRNYGRLEATSSSAEIFNAGLLESTGTVSTVNMDNWNNHSGVASFSSLDSSITSLAVQRGAHFRSSWEDSEDHFYATTESELRQALMNPDINHVVIGYTDPADPRLHLTGDVVIEHKTVHLKGQLAADGHNITFGMDSALSGTWAQPIDMGGGTITFTNGAVASLSGLLGADNIVVENGATVALVGHTALATGNGIVVRNAQLRNVGYLRLENVTLDIQEGGNFLNLNALDLPGCQLRIAKDARMDSVNADVNANIDTVITNNGYLFLQTNQQGVGFDFYGTLNNQGWCDMNVGVHSRILGAIRNTGTIQLDNTHLMIYGSFHNDGTLYLLKFVDINDNSSITSYDNGRITGAEPIYVTEHQNHFDQ